MGSKTRLSSYCTKRANNGVNLVTSRKINTRLARPFPPINFHDDILIDDIDKVEAFNSYFTSISNIASMADNLPDNVTHCASSLDIIHISNQDVIGVIKNLKPNKACGFDQISHILLKESLISLALPISTLFDKSLNQGQFPDIWKMANVIPVFKGKDPSIVNNYRPISLLSCLGKVFERCIFKHLFNYLRGYNLISMNQSGFTPGDSTTKQLVSIYHDVCTSLDNQRDIQLIYFDISKAFDKVWHKGLLFKLETVGIKGNLLSWFHNYLSNRKQRVVLNGKTSLWKSVNAGVP